MDYSTLVKQFNIDTKLIENARNERFAELQLEKFKSKIGKVNYSASLKYFLENFSNDISFYRQDKSSGYNCIALYKNVSVVGIADFLTAEGKKIKSELPETEKFYVYSTFELKKSVLKAHFENFWDGRCRYKTFKPSAEAFWCQVEKSIFA